MARLPQPGADAGNWGEILNEFLHQSHDTEGLLKADSVGAPQIKSLSVTNAAIADNTIQESKLSSDIRDKLNVTGAVTEAELTDAVDTLTSEIANKQNKEAGKGLSANDYTTAEKGKLAGVATGATQNATDANLRDRTTHTGSQSISTITGLQTSLDGKVSKVSSTDNTVVRFDGTSGTIQTSTVVIDDAGRLEVPGDIVTNGTVDGLDLATYAMGYIVHGSNASTARPAGYSCITWAGSVQPTNAALNDIWIFRG